MSDLTKDIKELLSDTCKAAPDMTHGLKSIGNGNMKKGVLTVTEYFNESGKKEGAALGAIGAFLLTGAIYGFKKLYDWNKANKEKGDKIVKELHQAIESEDVEESKVEVTD